MGTLRATGFCALLTAVLATSAFAQKAQTREGFWVGGGMGYGSLGLSCEICGDVGREGGLSGYAKLGGTLRENILLGVEMNGWTKSEAGAGYSVLSADDGVSSGNDTGFGLLGGVGYDLRVGRNLSITPVANYFRGGFEGGSANVLQFGVGITSH
jgi:hypothetical protein